jgi:hypothetical protein
MTTNALLRPSDFSQFESRYFKGTIVITDVSLVFSGAPDYHKYQFVGGFTNLKEQRICTMYNVENIIRMNTNASDINPSLIIDEYASMPIYKGVVGVFYLKDVMAHNPNFNASKAIIIPKFKGRVSYQKSNLFGFSLMFSGNISYYTIT